MPSLRGARSDEAIQNVTLGQSGLLCFGRNDDPKHTGLRDKNASVIIEA